MEKKITKKKSIPTKEDLVAKLMDIVEGYDGTTESVVKPNETIRAIEVLSRLLGYNEADKQEIKVEEVSFEIG